jgi:hypothetical protein
MICFMFRIIHILSLYPRYFVEVGERVTDLGLITQGELSVLSTSSQIFFVNGYI